MLVKPYSVLFIMGPCVLSHPQPEDLEEGEPDVLFIKEESSEEDQEGKRRGLSVQEGEWGLISSYIYN